jgi:hypothetical protein
MCYVPPVEKGAAAWIDKRLLEAYADATVLVRKWLT